MEHSFIRLRMACRCSQGAQSCRWCLSRLTAAVSPSTTFAPGAEILHKGRIAVLRCARHGQPHCGLSGLSHARLLLTQHFLAVAADFMLRCSPRRGSGHSMIPTSVDFRPTLRHILHELTEGGQNSRSLNTAPSTDMLIEMQSEWSINATTPKNVFSHWPISA